MNEFVIILCTLNGFAILGVLLTAHRYPVHQTCKSLYTEFSYIAINQALTDPIQYFTSRNSARLFYTSASFTPESRDIEKTEKKFN